MPTGAQSFPLPVPSPGYRISGKEVEVRDSGSRHHQLCGCCDLQLIQSYVAPSHGPPARVVSPLFFPAKSLLLPKPRGKKKHLKATRSSPIHSAKAACFSPFFPKTSWSSLFSFRTTWSSLSVAATPRFKSQRPSSFAAPFPTPPTISYTCQHPRILPALLGCLFKSGQVWPHGMEPIFSKLSHRLCNQGEFPPSYILSGSHFHPPASKHSHTYLTYP